MDLNDFYRQQRAEYFSDSEIETEYTLPKEVLDFQLDQISTNQKHDEFEILVRRLLEMFISPNLIPQVGPTGGGDGKTDTETHAISKFISDRWFIPENGWTQNEKWAFAISAKKDWVSKIKSDVSNIKSTKRAYTKIFFITNQKPSSKKKKELQDKLCEEHRIDIEILDREWILSKLYEGPQVLNIAVESLNLSDSYKQKVKVGARDAERLRQLELLEKQISNPDRYLEYDLQLVEDALQAAVLSRMLEKPKDEVLGKFDRAIRFSDKLQIDKLSLKIHYQRAWTNIHWYNAIDDFIADYIKVKQYITEYSSIREVELVYNLYNIINGLARGESNLGNHLEISEESDYIDGILLSYIEDYQCKPSSSLIARTLKLTKDIISYSIDDNNRLPSLFIEFQETLIKAKGHLDYPYESYFHVIEILGNFITDSSEYDDLIETVAEISAERNSELSAAEIFLKRGYQKLDKQLYNESLIFFGKSVLRIAKQESEELLYLTLVGLSESYEQLGLFFASYCNQVAATSIAFKEWVNNGIITHRMLNCISRLANLDLIKGRISYTLSWHEILYSIAPQLNISEKDYFDKITFLDTLLGIRLLNTSTTINGYSLLPGILKKQMMSISSSCAFYKLGYVQEAIDIIDDTNLLTGFENTSDFFNKLASQPAVEQMTDETNLYHSDIIEIKSTILGCLFLIYPKKSGYYCKVRL